MAKYNESINSFTSGELSRRVHSRTDLDEYKNGVEEMLNFIPQRTGGAFRRMGTEHLFKLGTINTSAVFPTPGESAAWDNEDVVLIPYRTVIGDYFIAIKIPNDYGAVNFSFDTADVNTTTNEITVTGHTLLNGEMVYFEPDPETPGSILPEPLREGVPYFTINTGSDDLQFSERIGDFGSAAPGAAVVLTTVGTGDLLVKQTNDSILGVPLLKTETIAIRIFSRDYDGTLHSVVPESQGHEQSLVSPIFSNFREIMPYFKAIDNLSIKGFKYVQFGSDLFITHASGALSPIALRIIGENANGQAEFLAYSPLVAPKQNLDSTYLGFNSVSTEVTFASMASFMPFQNQNTDKEVLYNIAATEPSGWQDGSGHGLVQQSFQETIIEARDTANGLIQDHFSYEDIGSYIQISEGLSTGASATTGIILVTSIETELNFGDSIKGTIIVGFHPALVGLLGKSHRWAFSSFSPRSGYPQNVSFYQNRLHFGGTIEEPATVWASDVNDPFRMRYNVLDQDTSDDISGLEYKGPYDASYAFRAIIASKSVSGLTFMIDDDMELRVGTPEGDFSIGFGRDGNEGYSRSNKDLKPQSSYGSTSSQVFLASTRVVYLSHDASSIRAIDTKARDFKYLNTNLSVLADHMRYQPSDTIDSSTNVNSSEFKFLHWQDGENILWAVNSRGTLVGLSLDVSLGIAGWHKHALGGDPTIVSICSAFGLDARYNDLVIVTRRNGKQQVEAIGETFDNNSLNTDDTDEKSTQDKARYLDAFIKLNSVGATTVITALHLANQTVTAFYNGKFETGIVLDGAGVGAISEASTEIIVGLPYLSRLKTLNLDRGQQIGSSRGNLARTDRVTVSLYKSSYAKLKDGDDAEFNSLELIETELFTGDKKHDLSQSSNREPKITIETDKPLPLNILGITTRGVSYDG